MEPGNDLMRN